MSPSPTPPAARRIPVLILGCGGWGTALAIVLDAAGREVRLWGHDPDHTRQLQAGRENTRCLPGVAVPGRITVGSDIGRLAEGVEWILSVIPTQSLRGALASLRRELPGDAGVITGSKGLEKGTLALPSRIIEETLAPSRLVVLSGPSHAEEVARGLPTTVVAASRDEVAAAEVQRLLATARFRIYTSTDPIGVEVGGAAKNVIAIASGIADGLGFGDNARAALLTRGLHEITRLGIALGGSRETFAGLSGMGDLLATATSRHSRNYSVGLRIAAGETLTAILASTSTVAEGVETTRSLAQLALERGVELPITSAVHAVLFEGRSPRRVVEDLMGRETKNERS